MAGTHFPSGLGASLGDDLAVNENLYVGTSVIYVDSENGSDSYDGLSRTRPMATLNGAHGASANDGIIVLMDGFSEELTGTLTLSKAVTYVGEGTSGGAPTSEIGFAAAGKILANIRDIQFRNILFSARSAAGALSRVTVGTSAAPRFKMVGCRMECGNHDLDPGVALVTAGNASDGAEFRESVFIVTADDTRPDPAISCAGAVGIVVDGCTFSGGAFGWGTYALDASGSATGIRGENVSLLLGSVAKLHADSDGWIQLGTVTGGGRVEW